MYKGFYITKDAMAILDELEYLDPKYNTIVQAIVTSLHRSDVKYDQRYTIGSTNFNGKESKRNGLTVKLLKDAFYDNKNDDKSKKALKLSDTVLSQFTIDFNNKLNKSKSLPYKYKTDSKPSNLEEVDTESKLINFSNDFWKVLDYIVENIKNERFKNISWMIISLEKNDDIHNPYGIENVSLSSKPWYISITRHDETIDIKFTQFIKAFFPELSENDVYSYVKSFQTIVERTFSYFFYKLLNPQIKGSFLMNDDFQDNVEKLIIKTEDSDISFEILNPLYKRISQSNSTEYVEIYTLILVNFLNFCQSIDIDTIKIKGNKRDDIYIHLICKLFNIYTSEVKDDLLDFEFSIPDFFNKEKFKINTNLIPNKLTVETIKEHPKLEYIFKCILGSFKKKKKKEIGVFTKGTVETFNRYVDLIQGKIDEYYRKKSEIELTRSGLLDFGDFFDINIDTDSQGDVYPDIYKEIEMGEEDKLKKGKKKWILPSEKMKKK